MGEPATWSEAWQAAEAKASGTAAQPPAPAESAETETPEAAPEAKDPKPDASDDADAGEGDDGAETDGAGTDDDKPPPAAASPADDIKALNELAQKLGYRIEAGAVLPPERAKFRAEKRAFHEKQKAEREDMQAKLAAAERYYAPMLKALKLIEVNDFDAALKELGVKGGLDEATERHLKLEANKDPRLEALEEWKRKAEAELAERREKEAAQERHAAQERARREHITALSSSLKEHQEFGSLAENDWYLNGVMAVQERYWDGVETLSPEDAAAEYRRELQADAEAKQVFEALRWAFGEGGRPTQKAESPKTGGVPSAKESSESQSPKDAGAGRGSDTPARQGGKPPPKTLSKRKVAEASPPGRTLSEQEWSNKYVALLKQSEPDA